MIYKVKCDVCGKKFRCLNFNNSEKCVPVSRDPPICRCLICAYYDQEHSIDLGKIQKYSRYFKFSNYCELLTRKEMIIIQLTL